jgi:hypothetical protein
MINFNKKLGQSMRTLKIFIFSLVTVFAFSSFVLAETVTVSGTAFMAPH